MVLHARPVHVVRQVEVRPVHQAECCAPSAGFVVRRRRVDACPSSAGVASYIASIRAWPWAMRRRCRPALRLARARAPPVPELVDVSCADVASNRLQQRAAASADDDDACTSAARRVPTGAAAGGRSV
jgi:hypothetical protein